MSKKSLVPIIFTLGNLSFGILSLIFSFNENYRWASIFILIAALLDRYDGRVARFLKISSELGKQLDSLADLVSFGVAPSILVFNMYNLNNLGFISYILLLIFPLAGAYRLARYNVTAFDGNFSGIPITIAGTFIAIYCLFIPHSNTILISILVVILSYLMVSTLKFKKF